MRAPTHRKLLVGPAASASPIMNWWRRFKAWLAGLAAPDPFDVDSAFPNSTGPLPTDSGVFIPGQTIPLPRDTNEN